MLQILRWARHPTLFLRDCARRYGETFTLRLAADAPLVFFSNPEAAREIFTGDPEVFRGGEANLPLLPVFDPSSLLLLDGAAHERQRRLLVPAFHGERLLRCGTAIRSVVSRRIARWRPGQSLSLQGEMQAVTQEVMLEVLFGESPELRRALEEPLPELLGLASGLAVRAQWVQSARLSRVRERLAQLTGRIRTALVAEIAQRRPSPGEDLLGMLLELRDDAGRGLDEDEVVGTVVTLLFSGNETAATTLAWALLRILDRRDVRHALAAELDGAVNGAAGDGRILELPYLDAVLKETLRLHPVFLGAPRRVAQRTIVQGTPLPAGILAVPCIYLTHRRPDLWPNPDHFEPARFLDRQPSPYEFYPFGGGGRRCLGAAFATYEMKLILAAVLSRASLRLNGPSPVQAVRRSIALAPLGGVPATVLELHGAHQ